MDILNRRKCEMQAIGGMLGLGGGASGTGFAPPQLANVSQAVDTDQTGAAYTRNQQALEQQQRLVGALSQQGGLQNQSQVYGQNQGLYNQLQGIAAGQGPNPAQAMLNQATGANVANQAALMAGQRGAGANVGLMARQAGMQGGNIQQQAVGQGATMQANQSLNALGQAQGVLGQAGGIANTQVGNQIGATNAYTGAQQAEQGNLLNALGQYNQANISNQGNVNSANAALTGTAMGGQQKLIGGLGNAGGAALGLAPGGMVPSYAAGGTAGPQSEFGQFLTSVNGPGSSSSEMTPYPQGGDDKPFGQDFGKKGGADQGTSSGYGMLNNSGQLGMGPTAPGSSSGIGAFTSGIPGAAGPAFKSGGLVDVVLSPGEKIIKPQDVKKAAGGKVKARTVPGRAEIAGDDLKNDKVPAKLPPGSVVVPRTKAKSGASDFVKDTLAKRGRGK